MLHIDSSILWIVVNLLVLLVLLRIFLFKPVLGMIEKRKHIITSSLEEADQKKADAAALKAQYEDSVKDAKQQSFQIVAEADLERMLKDAQGELAQVALVAASKLLGTTVDDKTNRDILDAFLAEAGDAR